MAHLKKISTTLSIAATVLLEACSSAGSETASGPVPVANVKAPELVGTWETGCIATSLASTSTVTQASGGGGTGGISGGEAYRITAVFNQGGRVEFTSEDYSTSNCNANTLSSFGVYNAVYFVGEAGFASDGSPVTEYSYSDSSATTYSIFYVDVGDSSLYLGDETASSPGNNGDTEARRIDGLGVELVKQ